MPIQDTIRSLLNTSNADDKFRIIADVLDALNPNAVAVLPTVNTYIQTGNNPPTFALVTPQMNVPANTPLYIQSNPATNPPTYIPLQ